MSRRYRITKFNKGWFAKGQHSKTEWKKDVKREPLSEKVKKKIRESVIKTHWTKTDRALEIKEKIRQKALKQFENGMSEITRRKLSKSRRGEKSYLWKGGISSENEKVRKGIEWRLWRESVFARDNWTCQKTGIKGGELHPHHIKNFAQYPELRFAIDNGITFSKKVHRKFHKKYGIKNNTREQLIEFLKND